MHGNDQHLRRDQAGYVSLATRWSLLLPLLRVALGDDFGALTISFDTAGTIFVHVDGDSSAFGLVDGGPAESPFETAERFLAVLVDELPMTKRAWGKPALNCLRPGHEHAMHTDSEPTDGTITFFCPEDMAEPICSLTVMDGPGHGVVLSGLS